MILTDGTNQPETKDLQSQNKGRPFLTDVLPEYRAWCNMIDRCRNAAHKDWWSGRRGSQAGSASASLLLFILLAGCGSSGQRPPSVPPAPGEPPKPPPATVTLCHLEISKTGGWTWQSLDLGPEDASEHSDHKRDHPGACDGSEPTQDPKAPSPKPSPSAKPTPRPDARVTLCHHFDRENEQGGKDRGRETITVSQKTADWHLNGHSEKPDRQGPDYLGKCRERED